MWRHLAAARQRTAFSELLQRLPQNDRNFSFGSDIDAAHAALLDPAVAGSTKAQQFFDWASRAQPCMFGRFGSMSKRNIGIDICWLDAADCNAPDHAIAERLQAARYEWKERAARGEAHGLLIMFNSPQLAYARPGRELLEVCVRAAELYLADTAVILPDVIYTEALPLQQGPDEFHLFKAGMNFFYTACHETRNHDRRVPGGLLLSINSVGHYANSLVKRGHMPTLADAVSFVRDMAWRSIGNGGHGAGTRRSTTWHNTVPATEAQQCPMHNRPDYVPQNLDTRFYSGLYHTDVLVPTAVTEDHTPLDRAGDCEVWDRLTISYFSAARVPTEHDDYGMFHGHPVGAAARFSNPWLPVRAINGLGQQPAAPHYLRERDGAVQCVLDGSPGKDEAIRHFRRLREHINAEAFPCIGARTAVARSSLCVGIYQALGAADDVRQHHADLVRFAQEVDEIEHPFVTYAALFTHCVPASELQFEQELWDHLQKLHCYDRERYGWDPSVEHEPRSPRFSYSVAGVAWFVVGLSPASTRHARRYDCAVLVFNAHKQFEKLRAKGLYGQMSTMIRQRDLLYSGSINPNLANFGEASEARQYSGRAVEPDWRCPLEVNRD